MVCEEALALDAIIDEAGGICCLHGADGFEVVGYVVFGVQVSGEGCGAGCSCNDWYLRVSGA